MTDQSYSETERAIFECREFREDSFRSMEVQICGETKTVQFCAEDHGGDHPTAPAVAIDWTAAIDLATWILSHTSGHAPRQQEPMERTWVRGWNEGLKECASIAERLGDECASNASRHAMAIEIVEAIRTLSDTSTDRPLLVEPDYRDVVRKWFELRLSQQREIAASIGLPPQGTATGIEWGKLVLTTAKDKGELPRVAAAISSALSDPSPDGNKD
jgi:hypothetical protein